MRRRDHKESQWWRERRDEESKDLRCEADTVKVILRRMAKDQADAAGALQIGSIGKC